MTRHVRACERFVRLPCFPRPLAVGVEHNLGYLVSRRVLLFSRVRRTERRQVAVSPLSFRFCFLLLGLAVSTWAG